MLSPGHTKEKEESYLLFSHHLRGKEYFASNPQFHIKGIIGVLLQKLAFQRILQELEPGVLSSDSSNFCDNTIFRDLRF